MIVGVEDKPANLEQITARLTMKGYRIPDLFFFFQVEDGIRDLIVTGVQTCALPISGNQFRTSLPPDVEHLLACGSPPSPSFTADIGRFAAAFTAAKPKGADYKVVRLPALPVLDRKSVG